MKNENSRIAAVVLAAGLSKRMGAFKPLLPIDGKPMILHVVERVSIVPHVVVVTGYESQRVENALLGQFVTFAFNFEYATGEMISSVQTGLRALSIETDAVLLLLADQPGVQEATLSSLISSWKSSRAPLVQPQYKGRRGHPLLISMSLREEILAVPKGGTLNDVVRRHKAERRCVEVLDPGVIEDLDTPEDLARWRQSP